MSKIESYLEKIENYLDTKSITVSPNEYISIVGDYVRLKDISGRKLREQLDREKFQKGNDIYGDLLNQKINHHPFPKEEETPLMKDINLKGVTTGTFRADTSFTGNTLDHQANTTKGNYHIEVDYGTLQDPGISSVNVPCGPDCVCYDLGSLEWEAPVYTCPGCLGYGESACTCGKLRPDLHKLLSALLEGAADQDLTEIEIARRFKRIVEEVYGEPEE